MARSCIFCNSKDTSREHIYPKWLFNTFTPEEQFFSPLISEQLIQLFPEYEKYYDRKTQSLNRRINYADFVTKRVCINCNSGWMSKLETSVMQCLEFDNDEQVFQLSSVQASKVALWAILKIILISLTVSNDFNWSQSTLEALMKQIVPEGFIVEIAKLNSQILDFRIGNQTITIPKYLTKDELEYAADCFFIGSLQVRNIGFRVSHLRTNLPAYRAQLVQKLYISFPFDSSMLFFPNTKIKGKELGGSEIELSSIETIDHLHASLAIFG